MSLEGNRRVVLVYADCPVLSCDDCAVDSAVAEAREKEADGENASAPVAP